MKDYKIITFVEVDDDISGDDIENVLQNSLHCYQANDLPLDCLAQSIRITGIEALED